MATKRAKIGDICEVKTPAGLAYIQYTHDGREMGALVRILPGLYASRPSDFAELAQQKELYFTFYTLSYALRDKLIEVVSHQPVPAWARPYPMMRRRGLEDRNGKVVGWKIGDASMSCTLAELRQMPTVRELTPKLKRTSIHALWPHPTLVMELARGWTPERDEELCRQYWAEQEALAKSQSPSAGKEQEQRLRHYLYFQKRSNAQKAGQRLRELGFSVEVRRGADGQWLAFATHDPPADEGEMETLRDRLESLASQLHGEYDGWEIATEAAGKPTLN